MLLKLCHYPPESLVEEIRNSGYKEAVKEALQEWTENKSLFKLEDFSKEYILNWTKKGFYITFGREPLINYIFLKQWEIRNLQSILRRKSS